MEPEIASDAVIACADLVKRAGAKSFEIGFVRDDVPVEDAGWYAVALYQGMRLTAEEHRSPSGAALALAERLLSGGMCRCRRPVVLSDNTQGCRWPTSRPTVGTRLQSVVGSRRWSAW